MTDTPATPSDAMHNASGSPTDSAVTDNRKRTSEQAFGDEPNHNPNKQVRTIIPHPCPNGDSQDPVSTDVRPPNPALEVKAKETVVLNVVDGSNDDNSDSDKLERQSSKESVATHVSVDTQNVSEVDPDADADELDQPADFSVLADLIDTSARRCTYPQGYVKRQLVYACRTCTLDVLEPAGMCLACALNCHDEHDIVALLTRRKFRCDCGNSKFGPRKCLIQLNKEPTNTENVYNGNFHGKICTCEKPIDNNALGDEHETVQCRMCEEQFHPPHVGVEPEEFGEEWDGELVCTACLNKHPFLQLYSKYFSENQSAHISETVKCMKDELRKVYGEQIEETLSSKGAVFPAKWFEKLCRCTDCMTMYKDKQIEYLLDSEDTCAAFEEREGLKEMENVRRASQMTPEEIFAHICEGFDPVTQVELAHWFNNLKEVFVEFIKTRLQGGQTITETDIEEFFRTFNVQDDSDPGALE
ncbi:putative E3 ubiquitin-protein ligase UBR7 [Paramacrobiotus metropolitanus]|uniref:putative E3 ubiquitin-protein ligase UBR7 n=1 Tax=Paramacrobiotus metropolitanus TaxID=2943436 RepID=UPI0024461FFA|nr:putative E3 ubiquitin-protein ligase UBR7 [Paramacrobiotus metropolitanus]